MDLSKRDPNKFGSYEGSAKENPSLGDINTPAGL